MIPESDPERDPADLGGESACWAHLLDDDGAPIASTDPAPEPDSADPERADAARRSPLVNRDVRKRQRPPDPDRPVHPRLQANLLILGVSVLVVLLALFTR